jgi:BMFP domain-containing protein YqiC
VEDAEVETDAAHDVDNAPAKSETLLPVVFREPERQLSKKELKKKELAELDAVLAELGLVQKEENGKQHCLLCLSQSSLSTLSSRS